MMSDEVSHANQRVKEARNAYIAANIRWMKTPSYANTIELTFWEMQWKELVDFYGDIIDPSLKSATIKREEWEK